MSRIKELINRNKNILILLAALAVYAVIISLMGIGCPIKYFTGISCAGCGMTRAWISVFTLDFKNAFIFHPLYPVIPLLLLLFLFRKKLSVKMIRIIVSVTLILFFSVYFVRMFDPDDTVVVFEPKAGIISDTINIIL